MPALQLHIFALSAFLITLISSINHFSWIDLLFWYKNILIIISYVSFQILDACAAPGSKTAQIIELLHGDNFYGIPGISDYYFLKVYVKLKWTEAQTF